MTSLLSPIRLSVAAPAYNEAEGLRELIQHWHTFLSEHIQIATFEIIICNDGSQDDTGPILDALAVQYPEVKPLHFTKNRGAAAALSEAISHTQFEWVLLTDTDSQFPIENLQRMLPHMQLPGMLAVMGIRNKKDRWFARFGSKISGLVCNIVHGSFLKDFNSAFKVISGSVLRTLTLEAKGMNYSTEITSRLLESKITVTEVDIIHLPRSQGKSNFRCLQDSLHRFLFVCYIALRQLLLKMNILKRPANHE